MPAAIKTDLNLIQAWYSQGATPAEIAAKFDLNRSTVAGWAKRYGWSKAREAAKQMVQQVKVSSPVLSRSVAGVSERVREKLADKIERQVDKLAGIPIRPGLANLARHVGVTKTLVDAARPVLGWDEQRMSGAVSVESMLDLSPVSTQPVLDAPGSNATQVAISESALTSDLVSEAQKTQAIDTQATEPTYDSFAPDL